MTEQDTVTLIETEQRALSNERRIGVIEADIKEIKNDQKAIYKIATSVELIAQRVGAIESKVDDTNNKVDAQVKVWQDTERKLTEKMNQSEMRPYQQIAGNVNSVKLAIITSVCSLIVTGILGCIIAFVK